MRKLLTQARYAAVLGAAIAMFAPWQAASPPATGLAMVPHVGSDSDAVLYAGSFGLSVAEAERRLDLQVAAGNLSATLDALNISGYAGLWIQHEPEFQVVIAATPSNLNTVMSITQQQMTTAALKAAIVFREANYTVDELAQVQAAVRGFARLHHLDTSIDIMNGGVVVSAGTKSTCMNSLVLRVPQPS